MCIIIDANFASDVFRDTLNDDYTPVINWLFSEDGIMVYGGKLAEELFRIGIANRSIRVLQNAGHAIRFQDASVNTEEQNVIDLRISKSNDTHIIALARVSGARTLCSHDTTLHEDFKNRNLIKPKGCIYQYKRHLKLLRHTSGCQRRK
jgi:predicted nucleic acid-binding protein